MNKFKLIDCTLCCNSLKTDSEVHSFKEIFNINEIQKIQDAFSKATGVASIITEKDGTPITKPSGFSFFCNEIVRKTELGLKNCMKSDAIIGSPKADGPRMHTCFSGGLLDGGASIMVGDRHIANWLIGQVLVDGIDIEEILTYCEKIGADKQECIHALKKVNRMTMDKFESICDFLFLNARMLSSLAVKNAVQEEEIKKRITAENLLSNEKELFRVTLQSIGDAVITTDTKGIITSINTIAEKLTGWNSVDACGLPLTKVFKIINEKTRKKCINPVSKVLKTGNIVMLANHTVLVAKDGSEISIADSGSPIMDDKGEIYGVVLVFRDVTEENRKNEKIKYLSYHDKLTDVYNRTYFEFEFKKYIRSKICPISIIVADVNGLKLVNDVFGHAEGDKILLTIATIMSKICRKGDVLARWGGDEFVIILPDTSNAEAKIMCDLIREECENDNECKIKPSVALGIATKEDSSESLRNIVKNAEQRMYRNKLLESSSARSGTVASLKSSMFEKSHETEEHALRIVEWSTAIAEKLSLTESEMDDLKLSAVLHDIGKIAISDQILNKPGKLDQEEWFEMKKHSEIGYRIAKSSNELSHIAEYILYHHERWDGTGYPHGKLGWSIPLISRIITVVDSFDAMTNIRPYKNEMSKEEAINELKRCSGKQFDPQIVDIFVKLLLEK